MITVFSYARQTPIRLFIDKDTACSGETIMVPVRLNGADSLCAFQFSMMLPEGVHAVRTDSMSWVRAGNLLSDHELSCNYDKGVLSVACLSMRNTLFKDGTGVACYVMLRADSVEEDTNKSISVMDIEFSNPSATAIDIDDTSFVLTVYAPYIAPEPDFSFSVSPFTFSGSLQSLITITSSADISSIALTVSVPEQLAVNNLVNIFSHLLETKFRTKIVKSDEYTYNVLIAALDGGVIPAGSTEIAGVAVTYVMGLIPADVYDFSLYDIAITTAGGKVYNPAPFDYRLDLTGTPVSSLALEPQTAPVSYFTLDGREVDGPVQGVTLVRHANGKVTKLINR